MTRLCVHYIHVNSDFIIQALAQTLANETSEDRSLPEDTLPNHFLSSIEELKRLPTSFLTNLCPELVVLLVLLPLLIP